MKTGLEFGFRFPPYQRPARQAIVTETMSNPRFATIARIADRSPDAWFKGNDSPEKRRATYRNSADMFVVLLEPYVLSDSRFYQEVSGSTHVRALELLRSLIPAAGDGASSFLRSETSEKIALYLKGIVDNRVSLRGLVEHLDGSGNNYEMRAREFLRSFPAYYLDATHTITGLPPSESDAV